MFFLLFDLRSPSSFTMIHRNGITISGSLSRAFIHHQVIAVRHDDRPRPAGRPDPMQFVSGDKVRSGSGPVSAVSTVSAASAVSGRFCDACARTIAKNRRITLDRIPRRLLRRNFFNVARIRAGSMIRVQFASLMIFIRVRRLWFFRNQLQNLVTFRRSFASS